MSGGFDKHWARLKRSLGRRWREWRLPGGYARLGTRYGGWWVDTRMVGTEPLLIDCGLGEDISFPTAFLERFGDARVIGVEVNPRSLAYCEQRLPQGMEIVARAFWTHGGEQLTFHLPRTQEQLPKGADGVSGSLMGSHEYVEGGDTLTVETVDLEMLLRHAGRSRCEVLKLDVEGAEYEILGALVDNGTLRRVDQLLVEFHHGVTHHHLSETEGIVARVAREGLELIHVEGRNYIFRRDGAR